jgi:hypothetical protein
VEGNFGAGECPGENGGVANGENGDEKEEVKRANLTPIRTAVSLQEVMRRRALPMNQLRRRRFQVVEVHGLSLFFAGNLETATFASDGGTIIQ